MRNFLPGTVCTLLVIMLMSPVARAQVTTISSSTATTTPDLSALAAPTTQGLGTINIEQIPGTNIQIGDFVVGPGRIEVTVKPGETVVREITVTNRISDDRSFQFLVEDMSGSASGKQAAVLLGDQDGPYSLRDYISTPVKEVSLALGERARVPVTISMPPNAEPGGYYGAVLVSTVSDQNAEVAGAARSPIVARVGTLFFITVPGENTTASELIDFDTLDGSWWFDKGPITFLVTHENTGSMHVNPYGELRVQNTFGSEVGFVELDPWFVLPKSIRTREVIWNNEFLLGRYAVTIAINRGHGDIVDTRTIHIWVLPWQFLVTVFGSLFAFFLLVKLFFSRFEFRRK